MSFHLIDCYLIDQTCVNDFCKNLYEEGCIRFLTSDSSSLDLEEDLILEEDCLDGRMDDFLSVFSLVLRCGFFSVSCD